MREGSFSGNLEEIQLAISEVKRAVDTGEIMYEGEEAVVVLSETVFNDLENALNRLQGLL